MAFQVGDIVKIRQNASTLSRLGYQTDFNAKYKIVSMVSNYSNGHFIDIYNVKEMGQFYTIDGDIDTKDLVESDLYLALDTGFSAGWSVQKKEEAKKCTCKSLDLFRYGCKCGAFKSEKK